MSTHNHCQERVLAKIGFRGILFLCALLCFRSTGLNFSGKRVSAPACLIIAKVGNGSPSQPSVAVEKSRPSAYMLDKYEEQPESPSKLAEAMSKTATAFTKGTETMLVGSKSSAIYLRRALMCGMAGRNKSKK